MLAWVRVAAAELGHEFGGRRYERWRARLLAEGQGPIPTSLTVLRRLEVERLSDAVALALADEEADHE